MASSRLGSTEGGGDAGKQHGVAGAGGGTRDATLPTRAKRRRFRAHRGRLARALLKGIAAAGMASALPRPAYAFAGGRVAIIGGGIAGLSALHHLREAGVDAHVYEGRTRTGGRMFTHRPAGATPFEVGGQLVNTDHDDMQALCKRFDVPLVDRKAEPHRTLILGDGRLLGDAELAEGLRGNRGADRQGFGAARQGFRPRRAPSSTGCRSRNISTSIAR